MLLGLVVPQLTFIAIPGTLFISALKAMAPILVAMLVASALSKASSGLGKRFRTVITFYISTPSWRLSWLSSSVFSSPWR